MNFRSVFLPIAAMLLFGACAHQERGPTAPAASAKLESSAKLPNGLEVKSYRLQNGLRLLLVQNASAPVFNYQIWVHAGSLTEVMDAKLKRAGLAHLFEHMMFRGTPKNPGRVYDLKLSSAGVSGLNATTSYDRTNFFFSLPKDKLDFAMEIEADRFQNLALDQTMFKNELGAVLGELKMSKDRPSNVGLYKLMALAFQKHPYGKEIIGEESDLHKMTIDEAYYFYHTYYAPNNFTLVLAGDFELDQALASVEKHFGSMQSKQIPHDDASPEPPQTTAREKMISHPAAQNTGLYIGYKTPADGSPDQAPLEVLSAILAEGEGSMLHQSLVDGGLASSVNIGVESLRQAGLFTIIVQNRPGVSVQRVQQKLQAAINHIRSGKLTEKELMRARNYSLLQRYSQMNTNEGIADLLAEGILLNGNYMSLFERNEAIKRVKLADVRAVATRYLNKNSSSTLIITPEKKDAKSKK